VHVNDIQRVASLDEVEVEEVGTWWSRLTKLNGKDSAAVFGDAKG